MPESSRIPRRRISSISARLATARPTDRNGCKRALARPAAQKPTSPRDLMNKQVKKIISSLALAGMVVSPAHSVEIEPPKIELVDKFGVNIANGQVSHSINTVSIGGAMGLSDRISVYGNEFNFSGGLGFNHKYYAQAKDVQLVPSGSPNYFPHN